ncbi:MAG: hypothetical protein KF802_07430 [Bdellovibrionaceae bacterium]|nr:hypothetical protein [Pseudobdellovibrionaceae bacterium]MBX3032997.1 hypothetical protein [Pseudobdellovibrionaceae bacterium]
MHVLIILSFLIAAESAWARASAPPQDRRVQSALPDGGTSDSTWINPALLNCNPGMTGSRSPYSAIQTLGRDMASVSYAAGGSLGFDSSSWVSKAMAQVQCPPRRIGSKASAGRCDPLTGYRDSSYDCAYYVRMALSGTALPAKTGGLGHAKDMGCNLQSYGFRNLCGSCRSRAVCNMTPESAPVGAVLVYDYRGCGHPAGHVEIRTSQGYVSDYFSTIPRTGSGRNVGNCRALIGVYVK